MQSAKSDSLYRFLKKVRRYQMNSVIDEKLRILISDALEDLNVEQENEKFLAKAVLPKPAPKRLKTKWKSFLTNLIDIANGKLVSDAEEKTTNENFLSIWVGRKKINFKNFLDKKLGYKVNSEIVNNLWDLVEKSLQDKQVKTTKEKEIATEKAKQEMRNDSPKPAVNAGDTKKVKKNCDLKTRKDIQKKKAVKVKKRVILVVPASQPNYGLSFFMLPCAPSVGLSKTTSLQSFAIRCIVKGCTRSRLTNNDARFFSIPKVRNDETELLVERRALWLKRVNIKEKQLLVSGKVCDKHFILGKPSYERDISNPDWAPTLLLENNEQFSANRCQRRYIRRQARALLDISAWFTRKGIICFEEVIQPVEYTIVILVQVFHKQILLGN
ncbi:hypothetical protein OUZ56_004710 [Daphnia magna]|uniref:THAP-type domain-containing protein n=1 Tax=Daphnia magna TaxID=35525 RepID=A0ABQ9YQL9_9CRUS|nr:hypothetical protein OUZ56_004710 [Daphnia magna]